MTTLNGHRATSARVNIPAWGCWYAEVALDGEHTLSGSVTLKMADLTLVGTVLSGGPQKGRSNYRIVAGAGGWGRDLPKLSYASDASVKVSTVLGDAAASVGENLAAVASTARLGPGWARQAGPANTLLNLIAPRAWYVDEAGVTRLGARAAGALVGTAARITPVDLARGKVVLAAEKIATILPGLVVDGLTAVDVLHEVSADGGLRSTVWGSQAPSTLDALSALIRQLDPDRDFRGVTEYRIGTLSGDRLNLQPVRVSSGMPDLKRVPVWPGLPGCSQTPPTGSRCLVGFIDSDPGRPYVAAFEDGAASAGLELITDGIGTGGHAITLEQVLGLFAQYTAARYVLGDLGATFSPVYAGAPPATLAALIATMITGAVTPGPVGVTPGATLDALGLPALIAAAHLIQLPDPASLGLPTPVMPGLSKKDFRL